MPPKMAKPFGADAVEGRKQPTAQEAYMFYTVIRNMKGKPEIDWAGVASDNNFKNAETAKVRYGQIKRKLGLDNWGVPVKTKDASDGNSGSAGGPVDGNAGLAMPVTPSTGRTKKTAATPGTPTAATGAGVKKRTSGKRATNPSSGGRGRKPKSMAMVKLEDEDDDMMIVENPAQDNAIGVPVKAEYNNGAVSMEQYMNFPEALPLDVLKRQALLDYKNGEWVMSPVTEARHSDWLARLPGNIQASFYAQILAHNSATSNSYVNDNDEDAAAKDQLAREAYEAQLVQARAQARAHASVHGLYATANNGMQFPPAMPMSTSMATQMGYMPASAAGTAAGAAVNHNHSGNNTNGNSNASANTNNVNEDVDLHSVPMHPAYLERMQRENEARDKDMLFGGNVGDGMMNWD